MPTYTTPAKAQETILNSANGLATAVLDLKPHSWNSRGENYGSHFFPFINGEPRAEIASCTFCKEYRGVDQRCVASQELEDAGKEGDHLLYPFCGNVCGYFDPNEQALDLIGVDGDALIVVHDTDEEEEEKDGAENA